MKRIFCLIFVIFVSLQTCYASFEQYYEFYDNLDVKFLPQYEVKTKEYKTIAKNEKYMNRGKYSSAEKLLPDFIPNTARFISIYTDRKDFSKALEYAKKLEESDTGNLFPKYAKDYRLGVLYSQNGDYLNSNAYLMPYINKNSMAMFQVAQNYYYMQDLKTAENYAVKITPNTGAYFSAQELLYNISYIMKNPQKAYTVAKNLVKLDIGNPENYIRVATVTTNNDEKLINYYRAKEIYISQNMAQMVASTNELIAQLEQTKIDTAYKKITSYCKKPDWFKIKERCGNLLSNDLVYWNSRQTEFFESTNDCIKRYTGSNLAACFKDVNDSQEKLDNALITENARRIEEQQRQAQILQLMRQNALLEEQNRIYRYGYYNYPRYYRRGYWW